MLVIGGLKNWCRQFGIYVEVGKASVHEVEWAIRQLRKMRQMWVLQANLRMDMKSQIMSYQ
jgi:hypothetical protein